MYNVEDLLFLKSKRASFSRFLLWLDYNAYFPVCQFAAGGGCFRFGHLVFGHLDLFETPRFRISDFVLF